MGSGSGNNPTSTSTQTLSPQQQQILDLAMPGIKDFAATVPQRYQGSTVAGFTAPQVAGQEAALTAAPTQDALAHSAAGANEFYTGGDIWNPSSNPNLQGAVDAAVRPIQENLTQSTLPGIRGEAVTTGNFGGSRQGIAEGLASTGAARAEGDAASKVVDANYQTNVDAQLKAMGLTPTIQGAQTTGATTTSGVGDVQQALQQALLNQSVGNFNYDQLAPFLQSKELASLVGGIPGGTVTNTGSVPQGNPATQALGGAAAGATLGSAILPGAGTAAGAGLGALLPFLFNR